MTKTIKQIEPAVVARLFERFAKSGYSSTKFTESLYGELMYLFGFIAHYDRAGFYATRFATVDARIDTLTIMLEPEWQNPIEITLKAVVEELGLLAAAVAERDSKVERAERAELVRLKAKYG
jgi:hypothetical protein